MHEIIKYFMLTENQKQCLNRLNAYSDSVQLLHARGSAGVQWPRWPDWLWLPWLWLLWLWLPWRYRLSETIAGANKALRESAGRLIGSAFHEM